VWQVVQRARLRRREVVGDVERLARGTQDGKVGGEAVDICSGKRNYL
jgi:hypothetical protein